MRVLSGVEYIYDGLNRLQFATQGGQLQVRYDYDLAGNRLGGFTNGVAVSPVRTYDAANQVIGLPYDAVGNLLNDGFTTTTAYDALNRPVTRTTTGQGATTLKYNGDGVLVQNGTTYYTQDLASPLSQILSDGPNQFLYGNERLAQVAGSTRTWYATDALGSVRRTVINTGVQRVFSLWSSVFGLSGPASLANSSRAATSKAARAGTMPAKAALACGTRGRAWLHSSGAKAVTRS